jgi:hypothetical protein
VTPRSFFSGSPLLHRSRRPAGGSPEQRLLISQARLLSCPRCGAPALRCSLAEARSSGLARLVPGRVCSPPTAMVRKAPPRPGNRPGQRANADQDIAWADSDLRCTASTRPYGRAAFRVGPRLDCRIRRGLRCDRLGEGAGLVLVGCAEDQVLPAPDYGTALGAASKAGHDELEHHLAPARRGWLHPELATLREAAHADGAPVTRAESAIRNVSQRTAWLRAIAHCDMT